MILISETVYKSVTKNMGIYVSPAKSILRNNSLNFRRKPSQEPLIFASPLRSLLCLQTEEFPAIFHGANDYDLKLPAPTRRNRHKTYDLLRLIRCKDREF